MSINYKTLITKQAMKIAQLEEQIKMLSEKETDARAIDIFSMWLKQKKNNIEPNTYKTYNKIYTSYLIPNFTTQKIKSVKAKEISQLYKNLQNNGLSSNSVVRVHSFLYTAFKWAYEQEMIISNPMLKVTRPKSTPFTGKYYNKSQINRLLEITKSHTLYSAIFIASVLGLRRSEIVGLKWESIDFYTHTIKIENKAMRVDGQDIVINKTKTLSSRRILYMPDMVYCFFKTLREKQGEILKKYPEKHNNSIFVLLDEKFNRITLNQISNGWRRLINTTDLPHIRFHDLRHSCASILVQKGVPMKQVQEWLGHSNFATTANIYAHLDIADKQKTAVALDEVFN